MRRIQVITQKELVKPKLLHRSVVVVIDVFLATSSIIFLLKKGYEPVYPAFDHEEAWSIYERYGKSSLLFGENNGELIEGFVYPDVSRLGVADKQSTAIICSTNGTKAINMASTSSVLLLSSLINGHVVSKYIHEETDSRSIVIVCSGNAGHFSIEDMVGAGQLVANLGESGAYSLSDSAVTARELFMASEQENFRNLLNTETADLLRRTGFADSMNEIVENVGNVDIIPYYDNGMITVLKTYQKG